jgi:methyltransferase-like protein 23
MIRRTSQGLPLARRTLTIASTPYQLDTVEDEGALLAYAEARTVFPFGLMLWESAVALAEEIAARPSLFRGATVLELGCGVGLAGLVAHHLGAHVVQTDHDQAALDLAAHNAVLNDFAGVTQHLGDWHNWNDDRRYDIIIGADVGYDGDDHAAVLHILARNLAPGGTALLADPGRTELPAFLARAQVAGWRVVTSSRQMADAKNPDGSRPITVTLMILSQPTV